MHSGASLRAVAGAALARGRGSYRLAVGGAGGSYEWDLAEVRFGLARALSLRRGAGPRPGRELATQAREFYQRAGERHPGKLTGVERWLAQHAKR